MHILRVKGGVSGAWRALSEIICFPTGPFPGSRSRHAPISADYQGFHAAAFLLCLLMLQKNTVRSLGPFRNAFFVRSAGQKKRRFPAALRANLLPARGATSAEIGSLTAGCLRTCGLACWHAAWRCSSRSLQRRVADRGERLPQPSQRSPRNLDTSFRRAA